MMQENVIRYIETYSTLRRERLVIIILVFQLFVLH